MIAHGFDAVPVELIKTSGDKVKMEQKGRWILTVFFMLTGLRRSRLTAVGALNLCYCVLAPYLTLSKPGDDDDGDTRRY